MNNSPEKINQLNPDKWVDLYLEYLLNYTTFRIQCKEIAKDLVQDTFIAGLKSAKNFKGEASERTWLISILKRKIIDHYRKMNSTKYKSEINLSDYQNTENSLNWLEEQVADPFSLRHNDTIENKELGLVIKNCVSKLPQKYADAFTLRVIDGYSSEAVCDQLNINKSTLWVIIHRCKLKLRGYLNASWQK